jgi:hypothetical protein
MSAPKLAVEFNEAFFDSVFRRMGWEKVPRIQGHTLGGETADYLGEGYVLELKHLRTNSFEEEGQKGDNRRLKLLKFQTEQFHAGNLLADWVNQMTVPTPGKRDEFNRALWTYHLGNSFRNTMETADGQIANTRRLRPARPLRGAVLVVNEVFGVLATTGLANLLVSYLMERLPNGPDRRRLENTDVAFGFCVHLEEVESPQAAGHVHTLICAGPSTPTAEDFELQSKIQDAITAEVQTRGTAVIPLATVDPSALRPGRRVQVVNIAPRPMQLIVEAAASDFEPGFSGIIKRTWERARVHAHAEAGNETKRCHYTPRFLLAKWAEPDGKIRVREIATGIETLRSPSQVAVRSDLYSLMLPSGELERRFLEKFFQIVEDAAARVLAKPLLAIRNGTPEAVFEFTPDARQVLALFTALQLVRLPTVLDQLIAEWKVEWKDEWGFSAGGSAHLGNFFYRLLGALDPFAGYGSWFADLAQTLHDKRWALLYSEAPGPRIQTGDIPARLAIRPGMPASNDPKSWVVQMPLSPNTLLALDEVLPGKQPLAEGCHQLVPSEEPWVWNAPGLKELIL